MKLSFSTFYNTNCFWEFRRPSPLSSRAKSQGRFEGMCMSCRPVDIHPVEGNKLKAKLCCLVSLMLLLLSAFFFSFSATQVQCIIVCQVFSFRILLVFPPSNCRLSSEWRSQVNLHQRQCDHVTVIICYLTFDFPFLSLDLILFAMLYFSARLFVQTWSSLGLWSLVFDFWSLSARRRQRLIDLQGPWLRKESAKGLRAMNVHTFRENST